MIETLSFLDHWEGILPAVVMGYIFIRWRKVGLVFTLYALFLLAVMLYWMQSIGRETMSDLSLFLSILVGTLVGGWRYIYYRNIIPFDFQPQFLGRLWDFFRSLNLKRPDLSGHQSYTQPKTEQKSGSESRWSRSQRGDTPKSRPQAPRRPWRGKTPKDTSREEKEAQRRAQRRKERFKQSSKKSHTTPPKKAPSPKTSRTAYEILGLSIGASQDDIKSAFQSLRSQYNPDKYQSMSPSFQKETSDELVQINLAYRKLKK